MMRQLNKLVLGIIFLFLVISITAGCSIDKEAEAKKSFGKISSMHPIKNLEDLYDREGCRDDQFDRNDKDTRIINSEMVVQPNSEDMIAKGTVLYMNRSTRTTNGYYYVDVTKDEDERKPHDNEKRCPAKIVGSKIIPTKEIKDEKMRKETENFEFFVQYGDSKNLKNYKGGDVSYNPEVPSYSAKYRLINDDHSVKQLHKRHDIPTNKAPKLLLKGSGNLKGSSAGYRDIEFTPVEKREENIYFSDNLDYKKGEDV